MKRIVLTLLLLFPVLAQAGPWCLFTDATESCTFKDAEVCYRAASERGGFCRPNAREVGVMGGNRWCIVTATSKNCVHRFKKRCMSDARGKPGAACIENIDQLLAQKRMRGAGDSGLGECKDLVCDMRMSGGSSAPPSGGPSGPPSGGPSGGPP
jgi:hypothetical protein